MSERAKRILALISIVVVLASYFGVGYYFGAKNRDARQQRQQQGEP